ncbi:MAG: 50S ribosomal protein L29 [Spirulina sp. SIO3F2]|nr:50S ribosomal protein L29 [Spirulina sp. SIO3F2]
MALPKVADARKLNDEELAAEILNAKKKLFELRLQKATRQLEKTHEFKHIRHWVAQLLTVERERELAAEGTAADSPAPDPESLSEQESTPPEEE